VFTRTNKRPVPLEHCLFYSGEVYKICERDTFLTRGFREANDYFKNKNSNKLGGKSGPKSGAPVVCAETQGKIPDTSNRGRDQKYPKHHNANSGSAAKDSLFWMPLVNNLLKKSLVPVCERITSVISLSCDHDIISSAGPPSCSSFTSNSFHSSFVC
jgi:antiviral helicase SKI2